MHPRILVTCLAVLLGLLIAPPAEAAPVAGVGTRTTPLAPATRDLALPLDAGVPQVGTGRTTASATPPDRVVQTASQPLTDEVAVAAVVVPEGTAPDQVWVRGVSDGVAEPWSALPLQDGTSDSFVLTDADAVEVATVAGAPVEADLVVHSSAVTSADASASSYAWDHPRILSRRAWQADESLVKLPYLRGQVTGAMIHHTAGSNTYTADQVPAILRSIQAYHVNGRGWIDIGYHVLVDRFGRAWEGRGGGINQPTRTATSRGRRAPATPCTRRWATSAHG